MKRFKHIREGLYVFLDNLKRPELHQEIDTFLTYKSQFMESTSTHEHWLNLFIQHTKAKSFRHVLRQEVEDFVRLQNAGYGQVQSRKTIDMLMRYHHIKLEGYSTYDIMREMSETKKLGRPPHYDKIRIVKRLRDQGVNGHKLSFRAIAKRMRKSVSMIHDWYKYPISDDELSTK
jgi:hypothetical protein